MLRMLPGLIYLGLVIYCLVDCLQSPETEVRNLPRWAWILFLLVPLIGPIGWLMAGRPLPGRHGRSGRSSGPVARPSDRGFGPTARPSGRGSDAPPATGGFPQFGTLSGPPTTAPRGPEDDPAFLAELERRRNQHRNPPPQS